jgi:hypothetical protein
MMGTGLIFGVSINQIGSSRVVSHDGFFIPVGCLEKIN